MVPQELDVVRFDVPVHGWPAGTTGTLMDAFATGGVVEISDSEGRALALVTVSYEDVTVVWSLHRDHEPA